MNDQWVIDLFYFLNKDYGTTIQYSKLNKANVNYDTGVREDSKLSYSIPGVITPLSIYREFLAKHLGKTEYNKVMFLILKSSLPDGFKMETSDYFVHGNQRYGELEIDDLLACYVLSGRAVTNALPYKVVPVTAADTIGINDGSET